MRGQILPKLLSHHRLVIRPIADVHLCNRISLEHNQVSADAVEEPVVVADHAGWLYLFFLSTDSIFREFSQEARAWMTESQSHV